MLFTSIVAHLEVLYCMRKFNLETSMLPEAVKMLNLISLILILVKSLVMDRPSRVNFVFEKQYMVIWFVCAF